MVDFGKSDVVNVWLIHFSTLALVIGLTGRVIAYGPRDKCSIPGRVIPKTQNILLDVTQHYKVRIKGKVKQSKEWSSTLHNNLVVKVSKRKPTGRSRLRSST